MPPDLGSRWMSGEQAREAAGGPGLADGPGQGVDADEAHMQAALGGRDSLRPEAAAYGFGGLSSPSGKRVSPRESKAERRK